jgi:hypothetical protein
MNSYIAHLMDGNATSYFHVIQAESMDDVGPLLMEHYLAEEHGLEFLRASVPVVQIARLPPSGLLAGAVHVSPALEPYGDFDIEDFLRAYLAGKAK